ASGPVFSVLDDPERLKQLAASFGLAVPVCMVRSMSEVSRGFGNALPILPIGLSVAPVPGRPDPANARAVILSIERAVALVRAGDAGAVVTNPIHKASLYAAGFVHPGHTEFLSELTDVRGRAVMMLVCPGLRVVPVTVHVALRNAIASLSAEAIVGAAGTTAGALRGDFGISKPRLAIAGLNPHAGEQGAMGDEEATIITPAIAALRADGIDVSGPWPPDTMFTETARTRYDAAICMYHDQALIPLKTLDMRNGVNVTLGLPIVRTSPDHGTGFDIAGRGVADPSSLIAALRLAAELVGGRSGD
ncbi:MAG: 4-hydroxythreonine-4-phosphate dehydrogenase PdxA, partial [Acetobacteraceae bacterium]|nr:4-hydroxythreonine-4-phosphate dehydrogenase PdxA [Acetobacteraceae bacterium]